MPSFCALCGPSPVTVGGILVTCFAIVRSPVKSVQSRGLNSGLIQLQDCTALPLHTASDDVPHNEWHFQSRIFIGYVLKEHCHDK